MIIVTGGAGFIGKHLVKRLEAEGHKTYTIDNGERSSYANYDVTSLDDMHQAFSDARNITRNITDDPFGIEEVIHLAYINGTRHFYEQPFKVMKVAALGILNTLLMCEYYRVRKFTLVSSSEVCRWRTVDATEDMPLVLPDVYNARYSYSIGKMMSEMMALHCGLFDKLTIVRPFNIYGPGMSEGHVIPDIIKQFEKDELPFLTIKMIGSGEETRSFCYIDDFIDGLMIAREKGEHRGIYHIGNPVETTIQHLVDMIGGIYGKSFSVRWGDAFREGDLKRRLPNIDKLNALGFEPKWTLWNGLKEVISDNR